MVMAHSNFQAPPAPVFGYSSIVVITVCAWCNRLMSADPEDRLLLSHGICPPCHAAARLQDRPVLVVSRQHARLVGHLERALHESEISVVLDRRVGQRRQAAGEAIGQERRGGADRRQRGDLAVC